MSNSRNALPFVLVGLAVDAEVTDDALHLLSRDDGHAGHSLMFGQIFLNGQPLYSKPVLS